MQHSHATRREMIKTIVFREVPRPMGDIGYPGWVQIEGTEIPLGRQECVRYDARYLRSIFPPNA